MFTIPASGIRLPFNTEAATESLPVFCGSPFQATNLSYATRFLHEEYHFAVRACPSTQQQGGSNTILAQQSFEDQISVPAGSFLTMVAGRTDQTDASFRTRWYDAGAQQYISDGFIHQAMCSGQFTPFVGAGSGFVDGTILTKQKNLFILPAPLSITTPGQLNVQIVNLSNNTAVIDMAFFFACPNGHMKQVSVANPSNLVKR